jgi:hypothetical protein
MLVEALSDRMLALTRDQEAATAACLASDSDVVSEASARARAAWPKTVAPFVRLPVAGRWSLEAELARDDAPERVALWRGGVRVADDARALGLAYARVARPVGLTVLEVDARGEFGAFGDALTVRDRLLDPRTPATVAAVDAGDDGPPWLAFTLAAIVDTRRLVAILPAGATAVEAAVHGSAFAAVRAHYAGVIVCHTLG